MPPSAEAYKVPLQRGLMALSAATFLTGSLIATAEAQQQDPVERAVVVEMIPRETLADLGNCALNLEGVESCQYVSEIDADAIHEQKRLEKEVLDKLYWDNIAKLAAAEEAEKIRQAEIEAARQKQAEEEAAALAAMTTAQPPAPVRQYAAGCEQFRPIIEQYAWPVEAAMLTMKEESGCNPNAVSATDDHGLFQLHGRRVYDPAENIRIAYSLYEDGRVGSNNFSAWYAVCTSGNNPQPKYDGVNCQ